MWFTYGAVLLWCLRTISGSVCEVRETCGECISFEKGPCVWCPAKTHNTSRCISQKHRAKIRSWCSEDVIDSQSKVEVVSDENILNKTLQFTPKHIKIKARPKVSVNFTMTYKPVVDQALDIYLLIDNSGSMEELKSELNKIVNELHRDLSSESNNVQFGIGSFSEKPAKPYVVSQPETYSFKNDLKLGKNMSAFSEVMKFMKSVKNSDDPEAGLDALMQVMVCDEKIGWRKEARRIIVYCSDQGYHTAGDGKMLGIIKPNDMKCHLKNNLHDTALEYDYPSIGQLNKIAHDKEITTIFVIKAQNNEIKFSYQKMSKFIKGAQFVTMMHDKEIADIIKNEYKKMKDSLIISYKKLPDVTIDLNPDCSLKNNKKCKIGLKENITINASLTLKNCTKSENYATFFIGPMGLPISQKLKIDLEGLCKCDCEYIKHFNASECHNRGTYQCGLCDCDEGRLGKNCECDKSDEIASLNKCEYEFCSNRGICKCGKCECYDGYAGESCELSDYSCKFFNGKICAGNGFCSKSQCLCDDGWSQEDCSCSDSVSYCTNGSSEICSNNGRCICNKCECSKGYSGSLCSYCSECAEKTCKDLKEFANCLFSQNQTICYSEHFQLATNIDWKLITREEMNSNTNMSLICKNTFENGSEIIFRYQPTFKKWILIIQNVLELPPKANILGPVAAIIVSMIFGGLLILLIWKVTLQYLDKKEYLKFVEEVNSSRFNVTLQNPTYISPVVTFRNPRFRRDSNT